MSKYPDTPPPNYKSPTGALNIPASPASSVPSVSQSDARCTCTHARYNHAVPAPERCLMCECQGFKPQSNASAAPAPPPLIPAAVSSTPLIPAFAPPCRHRPVLVLSGLYKGKRWEVYAGSLSRVEDSFWEFDLLVNCTRKREGGMKNTIPSGLGINSKYVDPLKDRELVLDWPDMRHPNLPARFWVELYGAIRRHRRTLVFCMGGHGRTGTALSILRMIDKQVQGRSAVKWIRGNYCEKAVEVPSQMGYVERVGEVLGIGKKGRKGGRK